ncbi:hypothetical protein ABZ192_12650 [Streptomyces sp. NPDC006235]|uniref:hypothetical protein n=1 Tax=Streptomyces sp. NPDC006235 TaxID=3156736 RepID=UPI0033B3F1A3
MADTKTETNYAAIAEQIEANIERAASLIEAENIDGLKELEKETEALISSMPARGRLEIEGRGSETFTQLKKNYRQMWREAAQAKPKPETKAAPAPKAEVATLDYTSVAGVVELVDMGAERMAEGVRLHRKTSEVAKEIAAIGLDIWRRIPDKDGNPDIKMTAQASRDAMSKLYSKAGEGFERTYENEKALTALQRSVQYYRTDIRAKYLRDLDNDTPEAEEERKRFAKLLEGKPKDVPVSEFLAAHYNTSLKGKAEIEAEKWRKQRAIESGEAKPEDEPAASPDEKVASAVQSFMRDAKRVMPEDFANASEEAKAKAREELLKVADAVKAMIAATL